MVQKQHKFKSKYIKYSSFHENLIKNIWQVIIVPFQVGFVGKMAFKRVVPSSENFFKKRIMVIDFILHALEEEQIQNSTNYTQFNLLKSITVEYKVSSLHSYLFNCCKSYKEIFFVGRMEPK